MASGEYRKLALVVEYDGTRYSGFQVQPKGQTIQGTLEDALQDFLGKYVKTQGAGRTDAGAHAYGQVVAFNTDSEHSEEVFLRALNASLPQDIRVLKAARVSNEFDPRRHAERRLYRYLLLNHPVANTWCQKRAIFSSNGLTELTIRNTQRPAQVARES